jgi:hypothetical protein
MGGVGSGRHSTYPTTVEDYRAVGIDSLGTAGLCRIGASMKGVGIGC